MNSKILLGGGLAVTLNGLALGLLWGVNPHPYFAVGCALVVLGLASMKKTS